MGNPSDYGARNWWKKEQEKVEAAVVIPATPKWKRKCSESTSPHKRKTRFVNDGRPPDTAAKLIPKVKTESSHKKAEVGEHLSDERMVTNTVSKALVDVKVLKPHWKKGQTSESVTEGVAFSKASVSTHFTTRKMPKSP